MRKEPPPQERPASESAFRDNPGAELESGPARHLAERKLIEEALVRKEKELESKARELEETKAALDLVLAHRERQQAESIRNILANVEALIFPCLQKLEATRLNEIQRIYVDVLKLCLMEIGSPFMVKISQAHPNVSTVEAQVANLIKAGMGNKEIAKTMGVSVNTVMSHRHHLRKKLGVSGKKVSLRFYLNILANQ